MEDNLGDATLLQDYLSGIGELSVDCRCVESFDDGLAALEEELPDILLLDLNLPDRTGRQTVEGIVDLPEDLPIVVMTGVERTKLEVEALKNGADEFIDKNELSPELLRRGIEYARERHRIRRELRVTRRAIDSAEEGIVIADAQAPDMPLVYVNSGFTEMTGYSAKEVLGENCRFMQCAETSEAAVDEIRWGLDEERHISIELLNARKDGSTFWNQLSITPVHAEGGELTHFIGVQKDVSRRVEAERELRRTQQELKHRALYDSLTRLPNRSLFRDRLDHATKRAKRRTEPLAVAFIDIDDFKAVNDSLGHSVGDAVIRKVAHRLAGHLRDEDTIARFGGDEFILLFEQVEERSDLEAVGQRLEQLFARPLEVEGQDIYLSISIGFAYVDQEEVDGLKQGGGIERLTRTADRAMYESKKVKGTSWQIFSSSDRGGASRQLQRQSRIRQGIEQGEFLPHYQPIYRMSDQKIIAFEALARWEHPDRGLVSPGEFIPLAEQSDLICDIGEAVLEQVCRDFLEVSLPDWLDEALSLYINLSPRQVERVEVVERLAEIADGCDNPNLSICFEVTETDLLKQDRSIIRLHEAGYPILVDDFGTGFSSLARLKDMPFDVLKLDMEFVHGALHNEADRAIAETVAGLGAKLDVPVIGEGVEDGEQLAFLDEIGCQAVQGYYLERPMPFAEALALLDE